MSQTQTVFVQDLGLPQGAVAVHRRAWFQDLDGNRASAPRYTLALQSLCQQLNALSPRLPETSYRLRFFVKPRPIGE